jgi:hypothetical protein
VTVTWWWPQQKAETCSLLSLTPSWLIYTISCVLTAIFNLFYDISNCSLWFYIRLWLPAAVTADPWQLLATTSVCKTRGSSYSFYFWTLPLTLCLLNIATYNVSSEHCHLQCVFWTLPLTMCLLNTATYNVSSEHCHLQCVFWTQWKYVTWTSKHC